MSEDSKSQVQFASFLGEQAEIALAEIQKTGADEIELKNCSGIRLVKADTPAGIKRVEAPGAIISTIRRNGILYLVSQF
jgi:hypothetical protein